jgi:hypothetical protein
MEQWHKSHKKEELEWRTKDYLGNPEKHKARNDSRKQYKSSWHIENKRKHPKAYAESHSLASQKSSRAIGGRFSTLKYSAKRRGYACEITLDQLKILISKPCHYCQGPLNETGAGVDRKNNSVGYIFDNLVPCCRPCNIIKNDLLTEYEMLQVAKLLRRLRAKRNVRP